MWIDIDSWKGKAGERIWASDGRTVFEALVVAFGPGPVLQDGYFMAVDSDLPLPVCYVWTSEGAPEHLPPKVEPPTRAEIDYWIQNRKPCGKAFTNALRCLDLLQKPGQRSLSLH